MAHRSLRRGLERAVVSAILVLALGLGIQAVEATTGASEKLLRGSRARGEAESTLGSRGLLEDGEPLVYKPDIEGLLGRRKCLGLSEPWTPYRDAEGGRGKQLRRQLSSLPAWNNETLLGASGSGKGAEADHLGRSGGAGHGGRQLLRSRHRYTIPRRWQRPLTGRCRDEGKIKKDVKPAQKGVVDCLLSDKEKCPLGEENTLKVLHATESIEKLMLYHTPCITINKGLKKCATTQGNPETMRMGSVPSSKYSEEDVERNYTSCALIGNGPGLFKQNKAEIIDQHDAIFRFNSLHNVQYQGKKTTFRILNNKRVEGITKKRVKINTRTPGEAWIIWHYFSLKKYAELKKINENSRIMAPEYLKFELRAYFGIRKDLRRFGNGMRCPMNLNSGMHGILMALKMCKEVNLFGFSYQKNTVNNSRRNTGSKAFQSTVVSPRLSKHHDWHTDALVVKYLAMAGLLNIC